MEHKTLYSRSRPSPQDRLQIDHKVTRPTIEIAPFFSVYTMTIKLHERPAPRSCNSLRRFLGSASNTMWQDVPGCRDSARVILLRNFSMFWGSAQKKVTALISLHCTHCGEPRAQDDETSRQDRRRWRGERPFAWPNVLERVLIGVLGSFCRSLPRDCLPCWHHDARSHVYTK